MAKFFLIGLLIGALLIWMSRRSDWGGDDWGGRDDIEPGPEDLSETLDLPNEPSVRPVKRPKEKVDN